MQFCKSFSIKNLVTLYRSGADRAVEFERDRKKKKGKKGFACDRLQTYSTPDGFAILVDERSHSGQALPSVTDATRAAGWRKLAAVSIPPPSGSFDARNCAVAHETERFAMILLHGTKIQQITFTELPIETGVLYNASSESSPESTTL